MGIDIHVLNFLKFARRKQAFGRVATIGRQEINVPIDKLKSALNLKGYTKYGPYCEELLIGHFAATVVESFDNSDYEHATHIADMNKPLAVQNRYDTVIDGGCIEHIYNIPQALRNVSEICSAGGQILHVLPTNNFCGHGFWQVSPELFFTLYSEANGYRETEVFLADLANEQFWYQVREPRDGERANVTSSTPLYALVRTRRTEVFSHDDVQQSDYDFAWKGNQSDYVFAWKRDQISSPKKSKFKELVTQLAFAPFARIAYWKWLQFAAPLSPTALSSKNPHLIKISVSSLV
jgi:SAM-dependent methyltransferase